MNIVPMDKLATKEQIADLSLATKEQGENLDKRFDDHAKCMGNLFEEKISNLGERLELKFAAVIKSVNSVNVRFDSLRSEFIAFKGEIKKDFQAFESKMDAKLSKQIVILGGILIGSQTIGLTILFFLLKK